MDSFFLFDFDNFAVRIQANIYDGQGKIGRVRCLFLDIVGVMRATFGTCK
jgi:hypothetical protein